MVFEQVLISENCSGSKNDELSINFQVFYFDLGLNRIFFCSVYSGHHSILIPPSEVEVNPALWLSAVSQYRVRDTFCSYGEFN